MLLGCGGVGDFVPGFVGRCQLHTGSPASRYRAMTQGTAMLLEGNLGELVADENSALIDGGRSNRREHEAGSAAHELLQLQIEQFKHDEVYHREIARLTVQHRLNHYALHFAKYVGRLAVCYDGADRQQLCLTVVDSFIISLATANSLNLEIASCLDECQPEMQPDLSDLAAVLWRHGNSSELSVPEMIRAFALPVGLMAKACEAVDHLEGIPFRQTVREALVEIVKTTIAFSHPLEIELPTATRDRLRGVKERFFLHGRL